MLKPSRRDKKRYVVVKIKSSHRYDIEAIISTLWKHAYEYGGYVFVSKSNMTVMKDLYFPEKNVFVVRIHPKYVEDMRFVISNIKDIKGQEALLYVVGVSGTIKSMRDKFLR